MKIILFLVISLRLYSHFKDCQFPCNYNSIKLKKSYSYEKFSINKNLYFNGKFHFDEKFYFNKISYDNFFCKKEINNFIKLEDDKIFLKCIKDTSSEIVTLPNKVKDKLEKINFFYFTVHNDKKIDFFKKINKQLWTHRSFLILLDENKEEIYYVYHFYRRYNRYSLTYKYITNKKKGYTINLKLKYYLNINKIKFFLLAQSLCPNCNIKYKDILEFKNKKCIEKNCSLVNNKIPNYILNVKDFYTIYKNYEQRKNNRKIKTTFSITMSSYTGYILDFLLNISVLTMDNK